jgi:hypothetical protein
VISPLLLNVALHGMEQAAGVRYRTTGVNTGKAVTGCAMVVRYADDLVAMCHSREHAEQVKARLAGWLAPRGLTFNEDKTRVVALEDGFEFLGFQVRRYRNGKLLIKPSKAAVQRFRKRLTAEMRALRGANAQAVVARLNPIIGGWSAGTVALSHRQDRSPQGFLRDRLTTTSQRAQIGENCRLRPASRPREPAFAEDHPKNLRHSRCWIAQCNRACGLVNEAIHLPRRRGRIRDARSCSGRWSRLICTSQSGNVLAASAGTQLVCKARG